MLAGDSLFTHAVPTPKNGLAALPQPEGKSSQVNTLARSNLRSRAAKSIASGAPSRKKYPKQRPHGSDSNPPLAWTSGHPATQNARAKAQAPARFQSPLEPVSSSGRLNLKPPPAPRPCGCSPAGRHVKERGGKERGKGHLAGAKQQHKMQSASHYAKAAAPGPTAHPRLAARRARPTVSSRPERPRALTAGCSTGCSRAARTAPRTPPARWAPEGARRPPRRPGPGPAPPPGRRMPRP